MFRNLLRHGLRNARLNGFRLYSSFRDPYSVLGVGRNASASEIKKAYFERVKKYHPDTNKDPEASTKFIEIQNAYEVSVGFWMN